MNLKYITIAVALFSSVISMAQVPFADATKDVPSNLPQLLDGRVFCIDPGHGGHESDDRETNVGYGLIYWESEGNFGTANYLYAQLEALGVDVSITRTRNDLDSDPTSDPSLSERVAFSEAMDAEFFHSIHTNGASSQSTNYTLMLYSSLDKDHRDVAEFPIAKDFCELLAPQIRNTVYTTDERIYADLVFQPTWTTGYGVLNGHSSACIISEAAFHSNPTEGRRLKSAMYQESMAMEMTKTYLKQFGKTGTINYGEIKGVVDYNTDEDLNGVKVEAIQNGTVIREVTTDQGYDGYYFMGWMAPGDYQVRFSKGGVELKTENVTVTGFDVVENLIDLPAPSQVTFKSITTKTDGTIEFKWNALDKDNVGYRIYYSEMEDLSNWKLVKDETELTSSLSTISVSPSGFNVPTSSSKLYFKIVGVNKDLNDNYGGSDELVSHDSKVYSIYYSTTGIDILVVDGFDRKTGVNTSGNHILSSAYVNGLSKLDNVKSVSASSNEALKDASIRLANYDVVFWISGEESTVDVTFDAIEQNVVKHYLSNGGKFVVSGAEIGWDLVAKGSSTDKLFYADYLKATYKNDGQNADKSAFGTSVGEPLSDFDGLNIAFDNANGWAIKYPDGIEPVTGADVLMKFSNSDDGYSSAIGYKGLFGTGTENGGVIYFTFPIGSTVQADADVLISKSIDYLLAEPLANDDYFKNELTVYPNPVKGNVTISGFENNQEFELNVYSISGTLIYHQDVKSNGGEININSSDWNKGIYFLEARHDNSRIVKKLIKE